MLLFEAAWVSRWLTKQGTACVKEMGQRERKRKKKKVKSGGEKGRSLVGKE